MELEPGRYEIEVAEAGYETKREWVELEDRKNQHLRIALSKIRPHLWVQTDPENALIRILNLEAEFTQGMALGAGRYEVEISAPGYETKKEWVELEDGKDQYLRMSLKKLKNHLWIVTDPRKPR